MKSGFPSRRLTLMLLAGLCGSISAQPVATSSEDMAAIKKAMVYISEEQETVLQSWDDESAIYIEPPPSRGESLFGAMAGASQSIPAMFIVATIVTLSKDVEVRPVCLPITGEGSAPPDLRFMKINKNLEDSGFIESTNRTIEAAFEGKTWFENSGIYRANMSLNEDRLLKLLKKPQWQRKLPDAAVVVKNWFIFAPDYYRLWYITNIELYGVKAKGKLRQSPLEAKLLHMEKFASLYDIRDHFELPETPEDEGCCPKEVLDLWKKDGGKLYFDTVSHLAAENARMLRLFLAQPPATAAKETASTAVIALYPVSLEQEKPGPKRKIVGKMTTAEQQRLQEQKAVERKARKERMELREDGKALEKKSPAERKSFMLAREHETSCVVDIIETAPDRVIARDQNINVHYSLPTRNMKLLMQTEIDENEYEPHVSEYQKFRNQFTEKDKASGNRKQAADTKVSDMEETPDIENMSATEQSQPLVSQE